MGVSVSLNVDHENGNPEIVTLVHTDYMGEVSCTGKGRRLMGGEEVGTAVCCGTRCVFGAGGIRRIPPASGVESHTVQSFWSTHDKR